MLRNNTQMSKKLYKIPNKIKKMSPDASQNVYTTLNGTANITKPKRNISKLSTTLVPTSDRIGYDTLNGGYHSKLDVTNHKESLFTSQYQQFQTSIHSHLNLGRAVSSPDKARTITF